MERVEQGIAQECLADDKKEILDLDFFGKVFASGIIKIAMDTYFTILYGNESFYEMVGYKKGVFANKYKGKFKHIILDEDIPTLYRKMNQADKKGQIISYIRVHLDTGAYCWFMIQGKKSSELYQEQYPVFYCVVVDVTEFITIQEKLEIEEERYRIISDISNDINFEYDRRTDTMHFSDKYYELFGMNPFIRNYKDIVLKRKMIYKNDIDKFLEIFQHNITDEKKNYVELRLKIKDRGYQWFGIYYTGIFGEYGNILKIIGRIVNIDKEKREKEYLIKKSQLDIMTELYNKRTTEIMVEECLQRTPIDTLGALIIIDVDDFKSVNDTSGHLVGDSVLIEISKIMKKIFRITDIMGRVGGDEFLVYMKDLLNEEVVVAKLNGLCEEIKYIEVDENWWGKISLSIGVAIKIGQKYTYRELFSQADKALYCSKQDGKNRFTIYG